MINPQCKILKNSITQFLYEIKWDLCKLISRKICVAEKSEIFDFSTLCVANTQCSCQCCQLLISAIYVCNTDFTWNQFSRIESVYNAILPISESLNFELGNFVQFFNPEISQIQKLILFSDTKILSYSMLLFYLLSLGFYLKSILANSESQNLPILICLDAENVGLVGLVNFNLEKHKIQSL